jgi:hypothetical protein
MSEYELIDILVQHTGTTISLLQWWAGITLGLLVGVHVIGKDLNGYIASLLIAIYIAFTAMISAMASAHDERMRLLIADLKKMHGEGVTISQFSQHTIDMGGPPEHVLILGAAGFYGLLVCAVGYVLYCYRQAKKAD